MDAQSRQELRDKLQRDTWEISDVLRITAVIRSAYEGVYGSTSRQKAAQWRRVDLAELCDIEHEARDGMVDEEDIELLVETYDTIFNAQAALDIPTQRQVHSSPTSDSQFAVKSDPIKAGLEIVSPPAFGQWLTAQYADRLFRPCDYEEGFLIAFVKERWNLECAYILGDDTFVCENEFEFVIPSWFTRYDAEFLKHQWYLQQTGGYVTAQVALNVFAAMAGVEAPILPEDKSKKDQSTQTQNRIECTHCKGTGSCKTCRGSGRADRGKTRCYVCDGSGACDVCDGVGHIAV